MRGFINTETLTDIADAIRAKTGEAGKLAPGAMAAAIETISGDGKLYGFIEDGSIYDGHHTDASSIWDDPKVTKIGPYIGFCCCRKYAGTQATLPNVTEVKNYGFSGCSQLTTLNTPELTTIGNNAFKGCSNLETLSIPKVSSIGVDAFSGCSKLTTVNLPNVETFDCSNSLTTGGTFYNCTKITTVRFGKPFTTTGVNPVIKAAIFNKCTAITDIYVPWSEGEVDGAPWGATNATIHYDTPYQEV